MLPHPLRSDRTCRILPQESSRLHGLITRSPPATVLIALAALLATSVSLKAEGSKPEESQAEQPYTDQLGDNQVTSVKREITKGSTGGSPDKRISIRRRAQSPTNNGEISKRSRQRVSRGTEFVEGRCARIDQAPNGRSR